MVFLCKFSSVVSEVSKFVSNNETRLVVLACQVVFNVNWIQCVLYICINVQCNAICKQ